MGPAQERCQQAQARRLLRGSSDVLYDDRALLLEYVDEEHDEDRFVLLGLSAGLRTLVVCHCYREEDLLIRIISARKANREERRDYERRWKR